MSETRDRKAGTRYPPPLRFLENLFFLFFFGRTGLSRMLYLIFFESVTYALAGRWQSRAGRVGVLKAPLTASISRAPSKGVKFTGFNLPPGLSVVARVYPNLMFLHGGYHTVIRIKKNRQGVYHSHGHDKPLGYLILPLILLSINIFSDLSENEKRVDLLGLCFLRLLHRAWSLWRTQYTASGRITETRRPMRAMSASLDQPCWSPYTMTVSEEDKGCDNEVSVARWLA